MKVRCIHGYFIFEETRVGQISDFISYAGLAIGAKDDFYTFVDLFDVPEYTILGQNLLNFTAIKTFEGRPWEIFEQNKVVYDFVTGLLVPISSVVARVQLFQAGNKLVSNGIMLPGSLTDTGRRVKNYSAWFSRDTLRWLYSEVEYV